MLRPSDNILPYNQWDRIQIFLDWVNLVERKKRYQTPTSFCAHHMAILILKGQGTKRMGKQTVIASPGEWLFIQPGMVATHYTEETQYWQVAFSIRWRGDNPLLFLPQKKIWKTGPQPELKEKTLRLYDAAQSEMRENSPANHDMRMHPTHMGWFLRSRRLFDDWLVCWEEISRQHDMHWKQAPQNESNIAHAARYLEEHPMDQPIRVSEIAQNLGLSTRHFTSLFRQHYGIPPKAYRMQLKFKRAIEELQNTRYEIKEIAHHLGCSPVWLNIWLKKQTGKTPTEIRGGQWT